jgi:hypothetical protein
MPRGDSQKPAGALCVLADVWQSHGHFDSPDSSMGSVMPSAAKCSGRNFSGSLHVQLTGCVNATSLRRIVLRPHDPSRITVGRFRRCRRKGNIGRDEKQQCCGEGNNESILPLLPLC